jgi:hypothetical protein
MGIKKPISHDFGYVDAGLKCYEKSFLLKKTPKRVNWKNSKSFFCLFKEPLKKLKRMSLKSAWNSVTLQKINILEGVFCF